MSYVTAEEAAQYLPVSAKTLKNWARDGYPVQQDGKEIKVKLEGAIPCGSRKWGFNVKVILNFLENIGDKKWASIEENIKPRTVSRPQKTGHTSSSSIMSDSRAQLRILLDSQKSKQRLNATA